jgi:hypothetical protein
LVSASTPRPRPRCDHKTTANDWRWSVLTGDSGFAFTRPRSRTASGQHFRPPVAPTPILFGWFLCSNVSACPHSEVPSTPVLVCSEPRRDRGRRPRRINRTPARTGMTNNMAAGTAYGRESVTTERPVSDRVSVAS